MRDWKLLESALDLKLPAGQIERIAPPLENLETAFRPLADSIPHETEPVVLFLLGREDA